MADKHGLHAVTRIDLGFEWKQAQHEIGAAADRAGSLRSPCPDRWTDVVHGANASTLEFALESEIEIRRVDADEHIGTKRQHASAYVAAQRQQARQMLDDFGKSHDRELIRGMPRFESGRLHARAADASEFGLRPAFAQRGDESGAEQIAGYFAGDECKAGRAGICDSGFRIRRRHGALAQSLVNAARTENARL